MFSSRTSCEIIIKDIGDGGLEMIDHSDMHTYYKLNAETAGELVNATYWYQNYDNDGGIRPENNQAMIARSNCQYIDSYQKLNGLEGFGENTLDLRNDVAYTAATC